MKRPTVVYLCRLVIGPVDYCRVLSETSGALELHSSRHRHTESSGLMKWEMSFKTLLDKSHLAPDH